SAIGYNAGRFLDGGVIANPTSDYSLFLGMATKALADNGQNEIVIGYDTTGIGSNTIALGNANITEMRLANNAWISQYNFAGDAAINMFKVNEDDKIELGTILVFSEDSGAVTALDMPVSATPVAGTEESYSFKIDGDIILKVYGEADSAGGIQNEIIKIPITGGILFGDGNDTDQDLISVDVTGDPKLWWDEATDSFEFNKSLTIPGGSLNIGGITLTEDGGCLRTSDFHAHGSGGIAGYYKLHQGTTPSADKEADHSILWTDASEDLYLQNATGTDKKVSVMDTSNSLSVSRSIIPTTSADRAAINFGAGGSLIGATADTDALFLANAYYNSGYKYLTTDLASAIKLDDGEITLSTAISGIADNVITWKDVINIVVGKVFINETANTKITEGLTINQGANDDEIFSLKSSDVNHSVSWTESDTYFLLKKLNATEGGTLVRGVSDGDYTGLQLNGIIGIANPTDTIAAVTIQAHKYDGATAAEAIGNDETVLAVQNGPTVIFDILGDGEIHSKDLEGTYGGGSAFVCVSDSGVLYSSEIACP
ncbi:hypothetical protein KAX02_02730, partial [candidate division WOR-3 bacterium]|nr:hypothetical protein [candidate division WOR-3 bacterium]